MKILFFLPALNSGGAERVVATIANTLSSNGDQVEILTLNTDVSFYSIDENVTIVGMNETISKSGLKRKLTIPFIEIARRNKFISEVKSYKPDIVISFLYTTNVLSLLAKNKISSPLIISERSDPTHYGSMQQYICKKLYPKSDRIVCQGNVVANYYKKQNGRCTVIPNPLNEKSVGTYQKTKSNKIVTVGRLIAAKNHALLIDAFYEVKDEFPDSILEIYGEGELRQTLQEHINSLGLSNRVFLPGSKQNIVAELNDAACFVLSSDFEGFPNVLIEAMATGIPVISTDFPSGIARELITDGDNGFLIETGNKNQLIEALKKILSDKELQITFAEKNLDVLEKYSELNIAHLWKSLCEDVIKEKSRG